MMMMNEKNDTSDDEEIINNNDDNNNHDDDNTINEHNKNTTINTTTTIQQDNNTNNTTNNNNNNNNNNNTKNRTKNIPKIGPEPTLLCRKEIDALYETFHAVVNALQYLNVQYIITGGTLLGAIRQHSILFCDDDIDIAIINMNDTIHDNVTISYEIVQHNLQTVLDMLYPKKYKYQIQSWEGGDKIRPVHMNNIFIDLFVIRRYNTEQDMIDVLSQKKNGTKHSTEYVTTILNKIRNCSNNYTLPTTETTTNPTTVSLLPPPMFPCYHFRTRKAMEMWPKEVYRPYELFPLRTNYKFGCYDTICGPNTPLVLLYRAFGLDCFHVYYPTVRHNNNNNNHPNSNNNNNNETNNNNPLEPNSTTDGSDGKSSEPTTTIITKQQSLPPKVWAGGIWETSAKAPLLDEHYIPIQPALRALRRPTLHTKDQLMTYISIQSAVEQQIIQDAYNLYQMSRTKDGNTSGKLEQVNCNNDDTRIHGHSFKQQQQQDPSIGIQQHQAQNSMTNRTIYMDGVFDMFHIGHLEAIEQCAKLGDRVIIGVTGDNDATSYKRSPIICQEERCRIIASLQYVTYTVCPCPLIVTPEFMTEHNIDLVVHGFANDADAAKQTEFFAYPMSVGKFQRIDYYTGTSTTDIIHKIQSMNTTSDDDNDHLNHDNDIFSNGTKPSTNGCNHKSKSVSIKNDNQINTNNKLNKWFGLAISTATNGSSDIPYDPFPLSLRTAIEPHIEKARKGRYEALQSITNTTINDYAGQNFVQTILKDASIEGNFIFDTTKYQLLEKFLQCTDNPTCDLTQIHNNSSTKNHMLYNLTKNVQPFQEFFDEFVRTVIVPRFVALSSRNQQQQRTKDHKVYYQSFPCIRMIQPNEFSIGPHADIVYGHHPCSINFYIPLTPIGGTSSLFLESRPGSEDWHPIEGFYGYIKHFAGALCMHWTTENKTQQTRVSLDFRLIDGHHYENDTIQRKSTSNDGDPTTDSSGRQAGWFTDGYYSVCMLQDNGTWEREGPLIPPDARMGFPWTVKNWTKLL